MTSSNEQTLYRLVITVAGPGFSEQITIQDEDPFALHSNTVEYDGLVFERYGTDEDYVEVRRDYIVARSRNTVTIVPDTTERDLETEARQALDELPPISELELEGL